MTTREKSDLFWDSFAIGAVYGCISGLALLLLAVTTSCTTTRPRPPAEPALVATTPTLPSAAVLDSPTLRYRRPPYAQGVPNPWPSAPDSPLPARGFLGRLFGRKTAQPPVYQGRVKLKNVVINEVIGDNNNLSNAAKKAAGTTQATDSSTINTVQGGNLAAVRGDGNQLTQTAVPPAPALAWWKWLLLGYGLGYGLPKLLPPLLRLLV